MGVVRRVKSLTRAVAKQNKIGTGIFKDDFSNARKRQAVKAVKAGKYSASRNPILVARKQVAGKIKELRSSRPYVKGARLASGPKKHQTLVP